MSHYSDHTASPLGISSELRHVPPAPLRVAEKCLQGSHVAVCPSVRQALVDLQGPFTCLDPAISVPLPTSFWASLLILRLTIYGFHQRNRVSRPLRVRHQDSHDDSVALPQPAISDTNTQALCQSATWDAEAKASRLRTVEHSTSRGYNTKP